MPDDRFFPGELDGDDIQPVRQALPSALTSIRFDRPQQGAFFEKRQGFFRSAVGGGPAGFDFDEDQRAPMLGDEINLAEAADPDLPADDAKALRTQKRRGQVFTARSELLTG